MCGSACVHERVHVCECTSVHVRLRVSVHRRARRWLAVSFRSCGSSVRRRVSSRVHSRVTLLFLRSPACVAASLGCAGCRVVDTCLLAVARPRRHGRPSSQLGCGGCLISPFTYRQRQRRAGSPVSSWGQPDPSRSLSSVSPTHGCFDPRCPWFSLARGDPGLPVPPSGGQPVSVCRAHPGAWLVLLVALLVPGLGLLW